MLNAKKKKYAVSAGNYEKQYCSGRSAVLQIRGIHIDVHMCMNVKCYLASDAKC